MPSTKISWTAIAPGLFVLLWSTGFIGAILSMPHADPFTFLAHRFAILAALLSVIGLAFRARWPKTLTEVWHLSVAGLLMQGAYLGGVFWAISQGVLGAVAALIVGVQPILTAVVAGPYLGEKISLRQWVGLVIGFCGVALVVGDEFVIDGGSPVGIAACVVALLGITGGTLYQKRNVKNMDLRTGSAIQFAVAAVAMAAMSLVFEDGRLDWNGELVFAMVWLVLVLSLGAMTLLYMLIAQGAASKVASLFYLVPPVVAIEAWLLFDEALDPGDIIGMAVTMTAVALVLRPGRKT